MAIVVNITYRLIVGRKLTNAEVDGNFRQLATAIIDVDSRLGNAIDPTQKIQDAITALKLENDPFPMYTEDAPLDSKTYGRKNGGWIESGGIGRTNLSQCTALPFVPDYYVAKDNAAFVLEHFSYAPVGTPSQAVIPTLMTNTVSGVDDTNTGGNNGDGHLIGYLNFSTIYANTTLVLGQEYRVGVKLTKRLESYVANKHVIGKDSEYGGKIGHYVLTQLDDMRGSVQNVEHFETNILDPRHVETNMGGVLRPSGEPIAASRRLTAADSGHEFLILSNTDITLTLGAEVTEGFSARFIQGGTGKILFSVDFEAHGYFSPGNRNSTVKQFDEVQVSCFRYNPILMRWTLQP